MKTGCLGLCLLLLGAAGMADAAEIRLRSSTTASAPIVRLADVAEIFSQDPKVAEGLALVSLCPAPPAGRERSISQHELRQILLQSGVARELIELTGSQRVIVLSGSQPLVSRTVSTSQGAVQSVQQAAFAEDENPATTEQVPAESPPATEEQSAPQLIKRGAIVTIYARATGVQVTATGKALANGAAGEMIAVELDETREKVQARVVGPNTVEVNVGRNTAANRPISVPVPESKS